MLNKNGIQNLFDQIYKIWIEPEINKLKENQKLENNFKLRHCLIKLPRGKSPILEFNDDVKWLATVEVASNAAIMKNDPIFLHEIKEIVGVQPPEVDGKRVAFIYLFWTGIGYQIIFDFTPNLPDQVISKEVREDWEIEKVIKNALQSFLTEKVIKIQEKVQTLLHKAGLWAIPSLLPYPLSQIIIKINEGDEKGAFNLLLEYCNSSFLDNIISKWWKIQEFANRKKLILASLEAHKEKTYILSIHALIPHIEGIITDWIYTKVPEDQIPWRQESKTKKFKDLLINNPPSTYTYNKIVESTIKFILGGPVLDTFTNWIGDIDKSFPNRNVVGHGKFDESLFTELNSIKLFLLLDTIYFIISGQIERIESI